MQILSSLKRGAMDLCKWPYPTLAPPQLVLGFESLMPSIYELETALYIDPHSNISGEAKAEKDFKINQRLILQPRIEANAALQQVDRFGIGRIDGHEFSLAFAL